MFLYLTITMLMVLSLTLCLKNRKIKEVVPAFSFFCKEDDSDIKIAGKEPAPDDNSDAINEANELNALKKSGDVAKANELGSILSRKFLDADGVSSFGEDSEESEAVKTQRRLLLAFTAVHVVKESLSNDIIRDIVIKSFYDSLKNAMPDFYEELMKSGSFSFYTLCVRRGGEVEKYIGETFAMLCSKEKDNVYKDFGTALYLRFVDVSHKAVDSFNLK